MRLARVYCAAWPAPDLLHRIDDHDAVVCVASARHDAPADAAVRAMLGAAVGIPPGDLSLGATARGKPYLRSPPGRRGLQFNVSHSSGVLVVALSRTAEVGVDVERVRPVREWRAIAERMFDAPARARLMDEIARGTPEDDAFLGQWCRMEAVVKAVGTGLFAGKRRTRECDERRLRTIELPALPIAAEVGDTAACYRAALALWTPPARARTRMLRGGARRFAPCAS